MKIKLIVFDLAGTTVKDDKDVHRILKQALAKQEIDISIEDANEVMGIPKPVAIRQLLEKRYSGDRHIDEEWIAEIHDTFVNEMIHFYEYDASVGERDGVSKMFQKLKWNNIKVAVDTGFDRTITAPLLKRLKWLDNNLIDASVTSDEVFRGRPYPDMIYRAMELTGVNDVKSVAKVGDTASDLEEGTSAGCGLVVGVTSGSFTKAALQNLQHTHLIETAPDILEILNIK